MPREEKKAVQPGSEASQAPRANARLASRHRCGARFRRRNSMLRATLCALILGLALTVGAMAEAKWTVAPGAGIGPYKLGTQVTTLEKTLTRDPKGDHQEVAGKPQWIYYLQGIQAHFDQSGRAIQLVADKPGIPTAEGVQVGDPLSKAEASYGRGYVAHQLPTASGLPKQYYYVYKERGLGFQTETDRIILIYVFPPVK